MESRRYKKCEVCGNRRLPKSNILLSSFPLDPIRCRFWVKACGNQDLVHLPIEKLHELKFICRDHFTNDSFNEKGSRLLKSAVPTLNLSRPPLPDELFNEFPLHTKAFYTSQVSRALTVCTNTASAAEKLFSAPSLGKGKENRDSLVSTICVEEVIPVASTSGASVSMDQCQDGTSQEILVSSYKRIKKNSETRDSPCLTGREKLLLKRLQNSENKLKSIMKSRLNLDKLNSEVLKSLIESAIKNHDRPLSGKRWDLKTKLSSLAIYKRSPKAYRYMQNVLPLPSPRTLQRILKEIPIDTGIHFAILEIIKNRVNAMDDKDKFYTLIFDEIALKKRLIYNEISDKVEGYVDLGEGEGMGRTQKIAGHALVFMIQGLRKKCKQPIAHYFVEGTIESVKLAQLIKTIITKLKDVGIKIISTVCDQGPTNIGALNLLKKNDGLSTDCNYFFVHEHKIFIIFDIPHLFKSIRNNFYEAGIMEWDGKIAKWCYLKEAEQRNKNFLNFQKITHNVVYPNYKLKMRVKYAAHALSNTMSAILKMMHFHHEQSQEVNDTAVIIEEMDKLFDCTNGPASPKDIKRGFRENVSRKTDHIEKWNYYLERMPSLKFLKSESRIHLKNVRCVKGFQISLMSLKDIWNTLHKEAGFKYLNLRQLNQDSLENLFGLIRQHSVTNKNPTCTHFNAALKSSTITSLTGTHSRSYNCQNDENKLLISYSDITSKKPFAEIEPIDVVENVKVVNDICYPVLTLPDEGEFDEIDADLSSFEDQPVVYVSGYLAAKITNIYKCETCIFMLKEENPDKNEDIYKFITLKEWWPEKKSLTYPKKELYFFVNQAMAAYKTYVEPELHHRNLNQWSNLQLNIHCNVQWFKCTAHHDGVTRFMINFLSKLFIRKSCKIINSNFQITESNLCNINKKNQQQNKEK